jgi:hypothetical protein
VPGAKLDRVGFESACPAEQGIDHRAVRQHYADFSAAHQDGVCGRADRRSAGEIDAGDLIAEKAGDIGTCDQKVAAGQSR